MRNARGSSTPPASVSRTAQPVEQPRIQFLLSSAANRLLTAGWVKCNRPAASEKGPAVGDGDERLQAGDIHGNGCCSGDGN